MKKILLALSLLAVVSTASAQWHHHHGHHGPRVIYRDNWVAPLILGGIAGAVIANQSQPSVVVQQPPVVVQQPPVYVQRQAVCTEWKEIQNPDGQIYRERTCTQ